MIRWWKNEEIVVLFEGKSYDSLSNFSWQLTGEFEYEREKLLTGSDQRWLQKDLYDISE